MSTPYENRPSATKEVDNKTSRDQGDTKKSDSKLKISIGSKRVSTSPPKEDTKAPKFELKAKEKQEPTVLKTNKKVAAIFNNDESDSEEEMPLECRMKMRNIGRNTITSSGPNSFNKGKKGFTNHSFKQFELAMKPRNNMEKKVSYDEK